MLKIFYNCAAIILLLAAVSIFAGGMISSSSAVDWTNAHPWLAATDVFIWLVAIAALGASAFYFIGKACD